ncbi:MAG: hypothetical protein Q9208_003800 [Pyrenodesmia sp. 3 TL-2023]
MAFRFGSPGTSALGSNTVGSASGQVQVGPELEEIQTEALGFHSISGDAKLRLLSSPWPADALPPPTASLLSIASQNALLAAAGPTTVVIAGTEAVRKAFSGDNGPDGKVKSFTPQLTLELGMRISQVAFTADEKYLVLSAEQGGGLAVYEVQSLLQGNTQSAFEISTDNTSLRMLLPNPTSEKAELLAVVTFKGELMMANLTSRQFMNGPLGVILKDGVSCVSWSTRGKQLIAGLSDGSCYQLTPEGEGKNTIPRPPDLEVDQHVSAISWLENELFLVAYTTTSANEDMIPATTFRLVTRQSKPQLSHLFQILPETCTPFGMHRCPPYHFIQRLRNFPPSLSDLIVVASTASTDVGMFTRADTALARDVEPEKITKTFTTTTMANDSRRAQLPIAMDENETSPIGMALDLSSTEKVPRPLPSEEMVESVGPLPLLIILNNEGILTAWWIVYAESIRQGTTYPGLVGAGESQKQAQTTKGVSPFATSASPTTSSTLTSNAFGSSPMQANSFPKPAPANNAFGIAGPNTVFGASSALGSKPSVWESGGSTSNPPQTSGATFGQPAFGSPTHIGGSAFGAPAGLGSRPSPWFAPSSTFQTAGSTFGQPANLGLGTGSTFGSNTVNKAFGVESSGGFANFAKKPGFAEAAAAVKPQAESSFAKAGEGPSFGSGMDTDTAFGVPDKRPEEKTAGLFGGGNFDGPFKLGSTFKGDGTASSDAPKPTAATNDSLFGDDFAGYLGETPGQRTPPLGEEADMGEGKSASDHEAMIEDSDDDEESATVPEKAKKPLFGLQQTNSPTNGRLFGTEAQSSITPAVVQTSTPASLPLAKPSPLSTTPEDTPRKPEDSVRPSIETTSPTVKHEPRDESPSGIGLDVPQAPLPPDPTSKDSYSPGDTSQSSASGSKVASNDAPLPPDFIPSQDRPILPEPAPEEDLALPEDDDSGLDGEGSGVDVAQEISPITDPTRTPKITPGSSFGASLDKTPDGVFSSKGLSKGSSNTQAKTQSLFGEVDKSSKFFFAPPPRAQESPRSPSPIRSTLAVDRPDNARSVSAPNGTVKIAPGRKYGPKPSNPLAETQPSLAELQQRQQKEFHSQRAKRATEEPQVVIDHEDDGIAEILSTEVVPSKELAAFVAHEGYAPTESKPGFPAHIEIQYRDISSAIDTLGLNARNIESFVRGHSELCESDRSIADLQEPGWCLGELDQLMGIEDEISEQVDDGRISNVAAKISECEDLRKDLKRLRDRQRDISRVLSARSNQDQTEDSRYAQLPVDQASKQKELRGAFKRIQELTAEAEREVFDLRMDLAAQTNNNNKNGRSMMKPTVEAVLDTLYKMTSLVQQRSGDIDVLEAKMRKLRIPIGISNGGRESSPFAASTSLVPSEPADALSKSMGGLRLSVNGNGTPQKQSSHIPPERASRYRAKAQRRKEMNALVKQVWMSEKPIVRPLD